MKPKSVLPLAAVLALGAAWTLFTESGKKPLTVNMNPLRQSSTQTTVSVEARPLADEISELFPKDRSDLNLESVSCEAALCTVIIKGNRTIALALIQDLISSHPWLGSYEILESKGTDAVTTLVFQTKDSL